MVNNPPRPGVPVELFVCEHMFGQQAEGLFGQSKLGSPPKLLYVRHVLLVSDANQFFALGDLHSRKQYS